MLPAAGDSHDHVAATISPWELSAVRDLPKAHHSTTAPPTSDVAEPSVSVSGTGRRGTSAARSKANSRMSLRGSSVGGGEAANEAIMTRASMRARHSVVSRGSCFDSGAAAAPAKTGSPTPVGTAARLQQTAKQLEERLWAYIDISMSNDERAEEHRDDLMIEDPSSDEEEARVWPHRICGPDP